MFLHTMKRLLSDIGEKSERQFIKLTSQFSMACFQLCINYNISHKINFYIVNMYYLLATQFSFYLYFYITFCYWSFRLTRFATLFYVFFLTLLRGLSSGSAMKLLVMNHFVIAKETHLGGLTRGDWKPMLQNSRLVILELKLK